MKFWILHELALKASKVASWLQTLSLRRSLARSVWLHEKAIAARRLEDIGKALER